MRATLRIAMSLAALAATLAGCGGSSGPNGPSAGSSSAGTASASPAAGGVRTVLSALGLNIHTDPSTDSSHVGTAAQGTILTVVDHTDQNGGWYKVQGQTVSGWITGDPSLTAPGLFSLYQSSDRNFTALFLQNWTFGDGPQGVVFHPSDGPQTIVVRNGSKLTDFGQRGAPGYAGTNSDSVVVCGVTGDLNQYTQTGTPAPTPAPGTPGPLQLLAQVRLTLDASHALAIDYNYQTGSQLDAFREFLDSMTFPFPQCEQVPTAPSPT